MNGPGRSGGCHWFSGGGTEVKKATFDVREVSVTQKGSGLADV